MSVILMSLSDFEDSNTKYRSMSVILMSQVPQVCVILMSFGDLGNSNTKPPRYVCYPGVSVCLEDSSPRYPKYVCYSV